MLKSLGLIAWAACLLTLVYQSLVWAFSASWPSLTLMSVSNSLLGIDMVSLADTLPLDLAVKASYLLFTTELAVALWWTGVFFFAATLVSKLLFKR